MVHIWNRRHDLLKEVLVFSPAPDELFCGKNHAIPCIVSLRSPGIPRLDAELSPVSDIHNGTDPFVPSANDVFLIIF